MLALDRFRAAALIDERLVVAQLRHEFRHGVLVLLKARRGRIKLARQKVIYRGFVFGHSLKDPHAWQTPKGTTPEKTEQMRTACSQRGISHHLWVPHPSRREGGRVTISNSDWVPSRPGLWSNPPCG